MALTIICCTYTLTVYAQGAVTSTQTNTVTDTTVVDTSSNAIQSDDNISDDSSTGADSISTDTVQSKNDNLNAGKSDSLDDFDSDEDLEIDSALSDTTASAQKLIGIKRGYDRKRQVTLAIAMMVLIIFALGTSQSFNPK